MTAPKNGRPKLYPDAEESSGVHRKVLAPRHRNFVKLPEVLRLLAEACEESGIDQRELLRSRYQVVARRALFHRCRQLDPQPSFEEIADTLSVSKATVIYGVQRHNGAPSKFQVGNRGSLNPDFKPGSDCTACAGLTHRAARPACRCGLTHESEPPLKATDFAHVRSSFGQLLRPENLPDLPGYEGRRGERK